MKPLILEFQEAPSGESLDYSMIEYDELLNLSIDKNTGLPAIDTVSMETETFTKTEYEDTDSDRNGFNSNLVTETGTYASLEASDSDRDISSLNSLLETQTQTREYMEASDSDPR